MAEWSSEEEYRKYERAVTMTPLEMVREFHQVMGQPVDVPLNEAPFELIKLREALIEEEYDEVAGAIYTYKFLKELCDLLYVIYGWAATFGIDIDEAFRRVHLSNMSKVGPNGPVYRDDGKVMKSDNYKPCNLEDLV